MAYHFHKLPFLSDPVTPGTPTAAMTVRPAAVAQTATVSVAVEKPAPVAGYGDRLRAIEKQPSAAQTATGSLAIQNPAPAATSVPRAGVVLSIPIVSIDGTQQPILPGTPMPTPPWWQRVAGLVPDAISKPLLDGYLRFWERRAQALSTRDASGLSEVLDGLPFAAELAAIERLRDAGQLQRVDVDHSITLLWATPEEGAVRDTLVSRSATVPAGDTAAPAATTAPESYRMAYRLALINGAWKVTDAQRLAP